MINVLLLGGGLQGLSFGESLFKKKDMNVSVVSNDYEIVKSRLFLHKYTCKESGYGEWLKDIFGKERFDVIIPMGDKSASYLSKNKAEIEKEYHTKCAVPDNSVLSVVEDKSSFMTFCEAHDIPHPRTKRLLEEDINDVAGEIGFPALIKPDYSVGARGITRVNSLDELQSRFHEISSKYGTCTLQEFIDNPDYYYNVMRGGEEERHEWLVEPHRLELQAKKGTNYRVYDHWLDIPEDAYLYSTAFTECVCLHLRCEFS